MGAGVRIFLISRLSILIISLNYHPINFCSLLFRSSTVSAELMRRIWLNHGLYFGKTQSSQLTRGKTKQA